MQSGVFLDVLDTSRFHCGIDGCCLMVQMGKLKRRIRPNDITINIGKGAPIPECPIPGERFIHSLSCYPVENSVSFGGGKARISPSFIFLPLVGLADGRK